MLVGDGNQSQIYNYSKQDPFQNIDSLVVVHIIEFVFQYEENQYCHMHVVNKFEHQWEWIYHFLLWFQQYTILECLVIVMYHQFDPF